MFKILALALLILPVAGTALADGPAKSSGKVSAVGTWNADEAEKEEALRLGGNAGDGKAAFEVCSACHLPSGVGRLDGSYPKIAGQHATVLIKQIVDIRIGLRDARGMHTFVKELRNAQDVADVAAYVENLCIPPGNGRYPGSDADGRIAEGKTLYDRDCSDCHQPRGEGVKAKFYPMLAGQHYRYLARAMADIRDRYRDNSNPDMVKVIKKYDNAKLGSIAAYLASLPTPGTPCAPAPARDVRQPGPPACN